MDFPTSEKDNSTFLQTERLTLQFDRKGELLIVLTKKVGGEVKYPIVKADFGSHLYYFLHDDRKVYFEWFI